MTQVHIHPKPMTGAKHVRLVLQLVLGSGLFLGYGAWSHSARNSAATETLLKTKHLIPKVRTIETRQTSTFVSVDLPGSTEPFELASIYPRATGYIAKRLVDIGSRVHKGDLLVVIESPELDRRLSQAEAELHKLTTKLDQAEVNVRLAEITSERYQALASKKYATQQEADTYRLTAEAKTVDVTSAKAAIDAQKAEVQRLRELARYEKVEAPFDGVITSRRVDVGDLSNADSGNLVAGKNYLFKEADDSVLRVRVDVPQSASVGVVDGLHAKVTVPEMPGVEFVGNIARNSDSLSAQTRTLQVEVDIDNRNHALRPGLYVNVHMDVPRVVPVVAIPSEALIFDQQGMRVALVEDGHIRMQPIKLGTDDGTSLEVVEGLKGGESVVLNPFVDIADGQAVRTIVDTVPPTIAQEP